MPKWLSNNWIIGAAFGALLVVNAHAITAGWYR